MTHLITHPRLPAPSDTDTASSRHAWNSEPWLERVPARADPRWPGAVAPAPLRGEPPEPLRGERRESLRTRLHRAVTAPVLVGASVFLAAVIVAIIMSVLNSGGVGTGAGAGAGAAAAGSGPGGSNELTGSAELAATAGASPAPATAADASVPGAQGSESALVHVVGEVAAPGVIELPAGARVADAVAAAGGATEQAALGGVNLARVVADGEQILVPDGEAATVTPETAETTGAATSGAVSVNRADAAELERLPRVGPALAQRILEWRTEYGPFATVEALLEVPGIGPKTLDGFREMIAL